MRNLYIAKLSHVAPLQCLPKDVGQLSSLSKLVKTSKVVKDAWSRDLILDNLNLTPRSFTTTTTTTTLLHTWQTTYYVANTAGLITMAPRKGASGISSSRRARKSTGSQVSAAAANVVGSTRGTMSSRDELLGSEHAVRKRQVPSGYRSDGDEEDRAGGIESPSQRHSTVCSSLGSIFPPEHCY